MHLLSTVNRLSKSEGNAPVSMFVYGAERKFLRVFEDYVETTQNVVRAFRIELDADSSISLSTSTLDICDGKDVIIDPTAYPVMWTVLDEIHVFVVVDDAVGGDDRSGETQRPGNAAPTKQIHNSSAILTPRPQQLVKSGELIVQPSTPSSLADIDPQRNAVELGRLDKGKSKEANNVITQLRTWPMDSLITPSDDLRNENDFLGLDSPSDRGRDKGLPWDVSESSVSKTFSPNLSKAMGQPKDVALPDGGKKEKTEEPRKAVNGNSSHEERTPLKSALKRSPSQRSVRKEKELSINPKPTEDEGEDPRFEIYITGPQPSQAAQFKTRGRHPVRKVLQAACKAFGLDYDRAHLMLSVTIEDEDEDEQTHEFECGVDDTMTRCGVNSESRLFVRIDPESGDES